MLRNGVVRLAAVRRQLPAEYLGPIALLFALCFGFLLVLLFHLTRVQDDMEAQRQIELTEQVLAASVRLSDRDLRDYAIWDEAVIHLVRDFSRSWASANLGPYLGEAQHYDYVFVLNGQDEAIYTYGKHAGGPFDPATFGQVFASALTSVRKVPLGRDPLIAGYSRSGPDLFIFAVSNIVPMTKRASLPIGPTHVMAVVRRVDLKFFEGAFNAHAGLNFSMSPTPPADRASAAFRAPSGETLANLTWFPTTPGSALRRKIVPACLIVGFLCFCVAGLIIGRGRRALEALQLSENRARYIAEHDLLTGLPNRRAMQSQLNDELSRPENVNLLFMDLDGFKDTNDVYGHGMGDVLLAAVAARLQNNVGANHMLARVGGDEFAVALTSSQAEAIAVAQTVLAAFVSPFAIGPYRVSLGISIGIASKEQFVDGDELVRRADTAMYAAKVRGKHCLQVYDPALDAGRERRRRLETDLRSAIENDAIAVVFQNIVCARTHSVVAVEALARWHHPELGPITPDQFIPIAEASGLIVQLGQRILLVACEQARNWSVDLAVNLSPAQFWDRELANSISEVLSLTGFPADRLELEITEGYLMRRPEAAREILNQLKALGVRILLDDFGTGFASIGYLQQLGFDGIKIDKSFIAATMGDPSAADLAQAIIAIGNALDIPVTAEGVEFPDQAVLMQAAGCTRLQGWLFGRPEAAAQLQSQFSEETRLAS